MLKKNILIIFLSIFVIFIKPVFADLVIEKNIPNAKLIGQGELNYFVWSVYDAKLYAQEKTFSFDNTFALELVYKRKIDGKKIANISTQEIRKLGFNDEIKLAAWHNQMSEIFPDVFENTKIIGIYNPSKSTVFYEGENQVGIINDPEFGKWFFKIWLDEKTSKPELRNKLLGGDKVGK